MKAFPIQNSAHPYYGKVCLDCDQPMRVGDVAMVQANPVATAVVNREYFWHKRCIQAVLALAPPERPEVAAAVDRIRQFVDLNGRSPVAVLLDDGDDDD
jgi:hypothetical protein